MTLFLLALALSMDAFAAAISQGARAPGGPNMHGALRLGLAFGIAQALMPLLGWVLGATFAEGIRQFDHWVTFVLLAIIGAHMAYEGLASHDEQQTPKSVATGWPLFAMAIATSIDAAAAGVTLPLLDQPVFFACSTIGVVTFAISFAGVIIGKKVGILAGRRAEVLGGLVLIGLGTKILIEHLYATA